MARTDRRSSTGFLGRCGAQTSPSFVAETSPLIAAHISLHTSVLCDETPVRIRDESVGTYATTSVMCPWRWMKCARRTLFDIPCKLAIKSKRVRCIISATPIIRCSLLECSTHVNSTRAEPLPIRTITYASVMPVSETLYRTNMHTRAVTWPKSILVCCSHFILFSRWRLTLSQSGQIIRTADNKNCSCGHQRNVPVLYGSRAIEKGQKIWWPSCISRWRLHSIYILSSNLIW